MFVELIERGREKERNIDVRETWLLLIYAHNLGMCPDWKLNPQSFHVQDDTPADLATQSGQN